MNALKSLNLNSVLCHKNSRLFHVSLPEPLTRWWYFFYVVCFRLIKTLVTLRASSTSKFAASSSAKVEEGTDEFENSAVSMVPELEELREAEEKFNEDVERKRHVSRFPTYAAAKKYKMEIRDFKPLELNFRTLKFYQKTYALHGKASGIDPAISWPSEEELNKIIEEEKLCEMALKKKLQLYAKQRSSEVNRFNKV
jgi:hypothetical protein